METHDLWAMLVLGWLVATGALISWICETIQNRQQEKLQREIAEREIERWKKYAVNWRHAWEISEQKRRGNV